MRSNSKPDRNMTDLQASASYQPGDFINQKYEVYGVLGEGGFGVVYLVYSHETGGVYALKTFKAEFLEDQEVRKRFYKEASTWVDLGHHPYLVKANFVEEVSGRLYIGMDYIAPNEEGINSLEGYLKTATAGPGSEPALGNPDLSRHGVCLFKRCASSSRPQTCQYND